MTTTTGLVQLGRDPGCTRCPLHEECKNVCIPTTLHGIKTTHMVAILIVGGMPDATADKGDVPMSGKAGLTLRRLYIDFFKLPEKADVYTANAVRCRPDGNKPPNKTQLKSCHGFLLADVLALQQEYDEVIILCVGAPAASSVLGLSLKKAFMKQGDFTDWHNTLKWDRTPSPKTKKPKKATPFEGMALEIVETQGLGVDPVPRPCRVFSTFHPLYIMREPSQGLAVERHLQMLADYLDGTLEYELPDQLEIAVAPMPPRYPLGRLSLDIETYGIVEGHPQQRFYHPLKSMQRDHVDRKDLVQTVGLTWREPVGVDYNYEKRVEHTELRHAIFYMDDVNHRRRLWAWLNKCRREKGFEYLLGQNIVFDLMYLRHAYKEARYLLEDPLPIMDLMILNYLHDEGRPEKSLKALAPIFRVTKYGDTTNKDGSYKRYPTCRTPELGQYNCQDTAATLRIAEKIMAEIKQFYGSRTKKLSPFCMKWYSQILWLIVWMTETGIDMDRPKLLTLFDRNVKALDAIMRTAREQYDMPMKGVGSEKSKRAMMQTAVEWVTTFYGAESLPELETTKEKGLIGFSADNRNALMGHVEKCAPIYQQLKLFGAYQDVSGLLDRYLYPLLVGGGKKHDQLSTVLLDGRCYPKWFPVPSQFEDGSAGGTKQARIVAKGPPCQTFPPPVKKAIRGRFPGGWQVWFDYSQIELRVAALLSNDSPLLQAYREGLDLHAATAKLMFGDDIVNHPHWKSHYRQAGKTFNFRALFRGGAERAQTSLMKDLGIHLELGKIANIDANGRTT